MNQFYTYEREFLCLIALTGCFGSIPMRSALVAAERIDDLSGLILTGSADSNPAGVCATYERE